MVEFTDFPDKHNQPKERATESQNDYAIQKYQDMMQPLYRALSSQKEEDIQFVFSQNEVGRFFPGEKNLLYLRKPTTEKDKLFLRGQVDHFALHAKYHDQDCFTSYAPNKSNEQVASAFDFFYGLEEIRCEAIGSKKMVGVAKNLRHRAETLFLEEEAKRPFRDLSPSEKREVAFNLLMMEKLTEIPLSEKLDFYAKPFRSWLDSFLSPEKEQRLKDTLETPKAFYKESLTFLKEIFPEITVPDDDINADNQETDPNETADSDDGSEGAENQEIQQDQAPLPPSHSEEDDSQETAQSSETESETQQSEEQTSDEQQESLSDAFDENDFYDNEEQDQQAGGTYKHTQTNDDPLYAGYKIYTSEYDEIVQASELIDPLELKQLKKSLQQLSHDFRSSVQKIGLKLKRFLMAQQESSWHFDLEEGYLDPARLARIVATPTTPLAFKQEKIDDMLNTAVTILVDNSGSMRGRPIVMAATCTDVLASTLEQCGVKTEILGFTTCAWKGGRAREEWTRSGKPYNPGRLSDLRHIIYKSFDKQLRSCRDNFGLMLREGILKENIDGEAVIWAYKRLIKRPEKRKILIVISDGAPVDDSTASANHAKILDHHLRHVVENINKEGRVELNAVGIGHDVTRIYPDSIYIKSAEELATTLANRLVLLFADKNSPATKRMIEKVKRSGQ